MALRISSSRVFNTVLLFALKEMDGLFRRILGVENAPTQPRDITRLPKWRKLEPLVKSYLGNTLHLLGDSLLPLLCSPSIVVTLHDRQFAPRSSDWHCIAVLA